MEPHSRVKKTKNLKGKKGNLRIKSIRTQHLPKKKKKKKSRFTEVTALAFYSPLPPSPPGSRRELHFLANPYADSPFFVFCFFFLVLPRRNGASRKVQSNAVTAPRTGAQHRQKADRSISAALTLHSRFRVPSSQFPSIGTSTSKLRSKSTSTSTSTSRSRRLSPEDVRQKGGESARKIRVAPPLCVWVMRLCAWVSVWVSSLGQVFWVNDFGGGGHWRTSQVQQRK